MNAPNDNTTAKGVRGWWLSTPRSGPHRLISPWEYRHLGASGATRAAAGGFQLGIGLVLLSLGHKAETDQERRKMYRLSAWFLVPAAGNLAAGYWYSTIASSASALKLGDMRLLLAALLATLSLTGCANAGSAPRPASTTAAGAPAASAPFYLQGWQGTGPQAVSVINGFTGQVEAAIAVPKDAGSFPWMGGRKEWYPCGAAPDDRTFLLCDTDQY